MNPLGGVFCRRGTAKSVEQGASYSEGLHALSEWLLGRPCGVYEKSAPKSTFSLNAKRGSAALNGVSL